MLTRIKKAVAILFDLEQPEYQILTGSRRVIKQAAPQKSGFYSSDEFRYRASEKFSSILRKGEAVYYEIVGYAGQDSPIMPSVDNSAVGKKFVTRFGETTDWTYGCAPGQFAVYVYNWMISSPDGYHYSYPWEYIKQRCSLFGIKVVPALAPKIELIAEPIGWVNRDQESLANLLLKKSSKLSLTREELKTLVSYLTEDMPTTIGSRLSIREGVCVRVEHKGQLLATYKNKSQSFGILEGYVSPDTVNIEEFESYL